MDEDSWEWRARKEAIFPDAPGMGLRLFSCENPR